MHFMFTSHVGVYTPLHNYCSSSDSLSLKTLCYCDANKLELRMVLQLNTLLLQQAYIDIEYIVYLKHQCIHTYLCFPLKYNALCAIHIDCNSLS